ncbi:carbohydrate ABC transporter permease [Virgisporangium ochraceum]|uniref:Sugar ABC transporter permease n=1 Tax=Virgisporangium ochraceum TaxID=65505 RepID=A0A8J4EH56_9ACTN|nr:carbohydrate ABC transporter permease [Virgisporangium ochraceum]GIJ74381.1 sugar ABC transporter permease [Virgisporangium ochraceum]
MTMTAPPRHAAQAQPRAAAPRRRKPLGSGPRTLISEKELNRTRSRVIYWIVLTLTMVGFTIAFVFPLYWMFASAVKSPAEYAQTNPTLIPQTFHPETYSDAWTRLDIAKFFVNTVYYAIGGWLFQIVVDVAAAYALSKLRPMFGKVVLGLMLASLMLPASALLIPAYLTVADLQLLNTPWALWLPAAANAFNIYVLKRFFDQIPNDLLDAAAIDGAGRLRVLWSVVLPLSRPVLAVISIFAIIAMWKDFLWPLLVLQDPESQSLSVALSRLAGTTFVTPTELMAGLAIASIPMIAVFLVFQRQILAGLSAGSIKG